MKKIIRCLLKKQKIVVIGLDSMPMKKIIGIDAFFHRLNKCRGGEPF